MFKVENCYDILKLNSSSQDGDYIIYPDGINPIQVYCNMNKGGLTNLMMKKDSSHQLFNKNWTEYKLGFGAPKSDNYWLGLDKIHKMTESKNIDLFIEYRDVDSNTKYEFIYSSFIVDNESNNYKLILGSELFGDPYVNISYFNNSLFNTYDRINVYKLS